MLVFVEDEFGIVIDLCHFQSENNFQIPVTLRGKTIFHIQATISLKNRRFEGESAAKLTSTGTHRLKIHISNSSRRVKVN